MLRIAERHVLGHNVSRWLASMVVWGAIVGGVYFGGGAIYDRIQRDPAHQVEEARRSKSLSAVSGGADWQRAVHQHVQALFKKNAGAEALEQAEIVPNAELRMRYLWEVADAAREHKSDDVEKRTLATLLEYAVSQQQQSQPAACTMLRLPARLAQLGLLPETHKALDEAIPRIIQMEQQASRFASEDLRRCADLAFDAHPNGQHYFPGDPWLEVVDVAVSLQQQRVDNSVIEGALRQKDVPRDVLLDAVPLWIKHIDLSAYLQGIHDEEMRNRAVKRAASLALHGRADVFALDVLEGWPLSSRLTALDDIAFKPTKAISSHICDRVGNWLAGESNLSVRFNVASAALRVTKGCDAGSQDHIVALLVDAVGVQRESTAGKDAMIVLRDMERAMPSLGNESRASLRRLWERAGSGSTRTSRGTCARSWRTRPPCGSSISRRA